MQPYPHTYVASATGALTGEVRIESKGVPSLKTAPPREFDGPGDVWSPETLLIAAIADCYVLTFRGVSRAAKFDWDKLECRVEGVLERIDGVTRFSRYTNRAILTVKSGADHGTANKLLERAEQVCLVNNSLMGDRRLVASVLEC
ncbi:MAG: OsmC family protein [Proteobacteria bacterium]|nr:OsmC family protein [Pseudomonadota bacterium]